MTPSRSVDLSDLPAVDGHCHPLLSDPWALEPEGFLSLFTEGRAKEMPRHVPHTGYFRRAIRDLARRLDTDATVEAVLQRRRQLGAEAACRTLTESRVAALLVDTGHPPEAMLLAVMRLALPCVIHEVFRIETCAQSLLPKGLAYEEFLPIFREELRAGARRSVAFKSVIAYRSGLAIRAWTPDDTEKPLLDTLVEVALEVCRETGRPLQIHTGFGDPDIDLLQANPLLLRPVLEDPRWAQVRIVALHMAYPYFREAAFMAAAWPQFYLDLSLALPFLGPGAVPPLVEMLSLAPSSKLLYGSDLGGLPELFALSADWGRAILGEALGSLVERGEITADEGRQIGCQILVENATALYGLSG